MRGLYVARFPIRSYSHVGVSLGIGGYGVVLEVESLKTQRIYAAKVVRMSPSDLELGTFRRELNAMLEHRHVRIFYLPACRDILMHAHQPYIIKLEGYFLQERHLGAYQ